MSEHRMMRFGIAALVVVLLLVAGAGAVQQSAWSQGYMMGLIAGGGEGDALSQYVLYNSGRGSSLGGIVGGFFRFALFFFGLMLAAKFFFGMAFRRRWQMAGGPEGDWKGWQHHGPPWCRQDEPKPTDANRETAQAAVKRPPSETTGADVTAEKTE